MYAIIGNNMQLYIKFVLLIGECVPIQCQSSSENNNNGDGLSAGDISGIVFGFVVVILVIITIFLIIIIIKIIKYPQYLKHYPLLLTSVHACSDY